MKQKLMITLMSITIMLFSACSNNDDDAPILGAKVDVTVKNLLGTAQTNKTVYLYKDTEPTSATKPEDAYSQVVTDANGVATFNLNFTQLNILESQTSLYFAVFYTVGNESLLANSEAVTVKRNDSKDISLTIPL